MAKNLLLAILKGDVKLDSFHDWILGKESQDISGTLNRTEFVLYILNYIQEETNRFMSPASSSSTQPKGKSRLKDGNTDKTPECELKKDNESHPRTQLPENSSLQDRVFNQKTPENELKTMEKESHQRTPFQIINRVSPTKIAAQPFSKYTNETRRDVLNCSVNQESRNILTSTPIRSRRNSSGHEQLHATSPHSSGSIHSDYTSFSHTPRSSKSSGIRFNSSNGSNHVSPQSNSSCFSPSSPHYSDSFPDLGARSRQRAPQSPCLADFIINKPNSQKSRKRIKPTQVTTISDKDMSSDLKKDKKSFGVVTRPLSSFPSTLQSCPEVKEQLNFDEERNLLKQKRSQCLNISAEISPVTSSTNPVSMDSLNFEEEHALTQKQSVCLNISVETSQYTSFSNSLNLETSKFEGEQNLLKQANSLTISTEKSKVSLLSSTCLVEPDPNLINCVDRVIILATVYSMCLNANLVPNIIAELYLILTLLTTTYKLKVNESDNSMKSSHTPENTVELPNVDSNQFIVPLENMSLKNTTANKKTSTKNYCVLSSVHNCVMFAAIVIEKQIHLVKCLDKGIIKLLLENTRLSSFVPHLVPELAYIVEVKEAKEASCAPVKNPFVPLNGPVLYQSDTDNKDNFSSDMNFNFFKKQRDGFYEILHEWRTKSTDILWISKRFPFKVQNLLGISSDPVNMMHLARLFCSQLTSSQNEPCDIELDLPGVTKDKLSRLQARFSKPQDLSGSPRPPPQFPGEQQFYQQFLHVAVGSTFLTHVLDCLIYRLNLLDSTVFFVEGLSNEESKFKVQTCVSSCCLLAKFLGLIAFSPYRSNNPSLPDTLQAQLMVRQLVVPPVNIVAYLQRALVTNRLIVTVPWIVAFLGMMDSVTPYLPSYHQLLQLLVSIYCSLPLQHVSHFSSLLLRCTLGWLFDVSFFPEAVFFSLVGNTCRLENRSPEPADVDVRDMIDQTFLIELCPYLGYLRLLLSARTSLKQGTARHITPVSAQLTSATWTNTTQTIELQLEESFLSGQSASFHAAVEYVVDQMSSACIKYISSDVIASCKKEALAEFAKQKEKNIRMSKKQIQSIMSESRQTAEAKIQATIAEYCGPKVGTVLSLLLGPDISDPTVFHTTQIICGRRCRERIIARLNTHMNLTDVFSKLMPATDTKPSEQIVTPIKDRATVEHRDSAKSPPDLIIELQEMLCECIDNRGLMLTEQQVVDLISSSLDTIKFRRDLLPAAEHVIYAITVDLCIVLLTHFPHVVTSSVLKELCSLWSLCAHSGAQLERVMSARNVILLCQAGPHKAKGSWKHLSNLLVELLKEGLLTPQQLETQCVALFRQDWPPMVFTLMGACLASTLEKIKNDPLCNQNPKFILMLEWVKEMTEDLSKEDVFEDS